MSVTDKYKLVPYKGNAPCDDCPLSNNCDDYLYRLLTDDGITTHDAIFENCLNSNADDKCVIPQLIDDGEDTMQTVVEDVNYESEYILVPASKYWTCRACRLVDDCEEEVDNPLFTKCKDAMCDGNPLMPVKIKHGENTSEDSDS